MWPLAKLHDEFKAFLGLAKALVLSTLGVKIVSASYTLADLSTTAAQAAVFPAGCIPLGLSLRVTTAVVTSSATNTFDVGITGGDADAFGAAIAGALDTTLDNTDYVVAPNTLFSTSAQGVTLDAAGAETFSSGAVTLIATYMIPVVPAA